MAAIDIIKCDAVENTVVWKFPSDNLRLGSQLVVKPGQKAVFVYRGKVADFFSEGTVTLNTGNIPLLTQLLSLPFGGNTPFQAEVWFFNTLSKLETKWGLPTPVQVEDPKYGIILPVRAYGQYGFRIEDPKILLNKFSGVQSTLTDEDIARFFKGKVVSSIGTIIGSLFNENISLLNIASKLDEVSMLAMERLSAFFSGYGIALENFYFMSINSPEDDPSYRKLKELTEKRAELQMIGREIYQFDKSMDVLKTAAGNEGMAGGVMQAGLGAGIGLGMGAGIGSAFSQQSNQLVQPMQSAMPTAIPSAAPYNLFVNGQQYGPYDQQVVSQMLANNSISRDALVWRQGMSQWIKISDLNEFNTAFSSPPPPPPPIPGMP
jgi:membrane protease subunit (stomatin/prohibitin family)